MNVLKFLIIFLLYFQNNLAFCQYFHNKDLSNELNKNILEEIKLAKFNQNFNYYSAKNSNYFNYRYFFGQESSAAGVNAGLIVGVAAREPYLDSPKKISVSTLKASLMPQMIGQFIGGVEPLFELGLKTKKYYNLKSQGLLHSQAIKYVNQIQNNIDKNLEFCDSIKNKTNIFNTEILVQKNLEAALLDEYKMFHINNSSFNVFQNTAFIIDSAKNWTGGLGNMIGIIALDTKKPRLNGPAFMLTTISGALIMAAPIVSRTSRLVYQKIRFKDLKHSQEKFKLDITNYLSSLDNLIKQKNNNYDSQEISSSKIASRLEFYQNQKTYFESLLKTQEKNKIIAKHATLIQIPVATLVGLTKISLGVCGMIAGFKYYKDPHISQTLVADGSIPYICGTGIAMVDNLRILGLSQYDFFSKRAAKSDPKSMYNNNINKLDDIEKSISAKIINK